MTSLVISGRRWFDKRYGNTYFSAVGIIDGETAVTIDYEYGYGNHFEDRITEELERKGLLPFVKRHDNGGMNGPISLQCRENGIAYQCLASDVARKKDL